MHKEKNKIYQINIAHDFNNINKLWPTGKQGESDVSSSLIFQSLPFLKAWQKSYGAKLNAQIFFVEIYDLDYQPLLFLPLARFKKYGAIYLSFPNQGVADYNAPIIFQSFKNWSMHEVSDLLNQIITKLPPFDILDFSQMPEYIGENINPFFLLAQSTHDESGHYMLLTDSLEMIEKNLHRGKNTRQKQRQLQRLGTLKYQVAEDYNQADLFLSAMIEQKQKRFEQTHVPGFGEHPEKQQFFEQATREFLASNNLHLSALTLNNEIIATLWGLTQKQIYYGMMISFNHGKWGKYSPGMVLHYLLLRDLHKQGFHRLDLGIGDETWKTGLCEHSTILRDYIAAHSLRGRFILSCLAILKAARATWLWQKIRPLKWIILRHFKR